MFVQELHFHQHHPFAIRVLLTIPKTESSVYGTGRFFLRRKSVMICLDGETGVASRDVTFTLPAQVEGFHEEEPGYTDEGDEE
jgi:hypothetical protein